MSRQPQFVFETATPAGGAILHQLRATELSGLAYTDGSAFLRQLTVELRTAGGALADPASGGVELLASVHTESGQLAANLHWLGSLTRDETGRYRFDHHYLPAKFDNILGLTNLHVYAADASGLAAASIASVWAELH